MNHGIRLLCALLVAASTVGTAQDTLFAYRFEELPSLRYATAANWFDSTFVHAKYGEFALVGTGATTRIHFDAVLPQDSMVQHTGGVGTQTTLLPYLRTQNFVVNTSDTLFTFYRQFGFTAADTSGRITTAWRFNDRTEFVLYVRNAATNALVAVVDSVGIDSTTSNGTVATAFGTDPAMWCRSVSTASWPKGTPLYAQIVPRRYGLTPYGMVAFSNLEPFSQGIYYGCGEYSVPNPYRASLFRDMLFERTLAYMADVYGTTCTVPGYMSDNLHPDQVDSLFTLFMQTETIIEDGDTHHVSQPIPCESGKARALGRRPEHVVSLASDVTYTSGFVQALLNIVPRTSADVVVVHATSGQVYAHETVHGSTSQHQLRMPVDLPSGPYLLTVYQPGTGGFAKSAFTVVR